MLSEQGVCSRRAAEQLIRDGRVKLNGRPVGLGDKMDPAADLLSVDGQTVRVAKKTEKYYYMLHKPRGFITTTSDERGRKTVMELMQDAPVRVYPVGRLDKAVSYTHLFEVIALDMPIYGETAVSKNMTITFSDWVACGNDYVNYELSRDDRPIFLYGLSAGGMETYFVAAKNKKVKGIIGMTFLDQREKAVRMTTTKNWFWGTFGTALATLSCTMGLSKFKMKMSVCSKMNTLCNDENALQAMLRDKTSAGNKVNMKFLSDYMTYIPEVEPEEFDVCPIILTQPENDRWTPEFLSDLVLDKIKKVAVKKVKLRNGSHYPIEAEALEDLHRSVLDFINENLA